MLAQKTSTAPTKLAQGTPAAGAPDLNKDRLEEGKGGRPGPAGIHLAVNGYTKEERESLSPTCAAADIESVQSIIDQMAVYALPRKLASATSIRRSCPASR